MPAVTSFSYQSFRGAASAANPGSSNMHRACVEIPSPALMRHPRM